MVGAMSTTIAVVGLGGMGSRIARRLLDTGHEILVWNRTAGKAAPLAASGAIPVATPAEAAARAEVLITMVADPPALRAVTDGPDGIAAGADRRGAATYDTGAAPLTMIEMSTVGPAEVATLASALPAGTGLLDAPVLGSVGEASSGTLTIFVGGPDGLVERVQPVLSGLGTVVHVGSRGAGAAAKLVANASLFGTLGRRRTTY
jgi:3-hydroxyisobutyrate dehydrogenase-like beta-hydroxyacid dehydrogenase